MIRNLFDDPTVRPCDFAAWQRVSRLQGRPPDFRFRSRLTLKNRASQRDELIYREVYRLVDAVMTAARSNWSDDASYL